jgi:mannose-6-phosphate isomerase-like protein (cupin superfamily)
MKQREDAVMQGPLAGHEFRFSGHRFHVLRSARDTEDQRLLLDYVAPPGAKVSRHIHRDQEERFEVVSGTLGVHVGGRELILGAGQEAVGPPGIPHECWNPRDDEEVRFIVGIRPGLRVEIFLETMHGLARDRKTIGGVIPKNPLQLAVLAQEVGSYVYLTPVQKALFVPVAALAFVGRMLGYRTQYLKYSAS